MFLDAPKITCHSASAYLNDHDINIRCVINSNPSLLEFYWTLDSNGTTLKADETLAEYRTTATVNLLRLPFWTIPIKLILTYYNNFMK